MRKYKLMPFLAAMLLVGLVTTVAIGADKPVTFNDPGIANTWNRVDKAVSEIPGVGRSYTWGLPVQGSENTTTETYNGQPRKVQYFDKARMEVNNPAGNPNDLFYVTSGLLVKEMVSGKRQDGDNTFTNVAPSNVPVAGDPNDNGGNTISPTYASFSKVVTFSGSENGKPSAIGGVIGQKIDKAGNITSITPPEQRSIKSYEAATQHNIADVFVDFGAQTGLVWDGTGYVQDAVFFNNPAYVLGLPVTEPYWIRAVVGGVEKDVLVQLFERRVLTYTPSNPVGFKVEMGNVGQHYFKWRYTTPPPTTTSGSCSDTPAATTTPQPATTVWPTNTAGAPISAPVSVVFGGAGRVEDRFFYSPILKRTMPYRIYLPEIYFRDTSRRFPVLYALHGLSGAYVEWQGYSLLDNTDKLIQDGKIQPFIIVLPSGELSYFFNHANCGPKWGDYIATDVVNSVDTNYRTIANPLTRAIGGLSMGGHGALQLGFNHPDIFGIIGAHSPTLRTFEQAYDYWGDINYYKTIDPVSLAQTKTITAKIWIDTGRDDDLWRPRTEELTNILKQRNIPYTLTEFPGGHSEDYWRTYVNNYILWYGSAFPRP